MTSLYSANGELAGDPLVVLARPKNVRNEYGLPSLPQSPTKTIDDNLAWWDPMPKELCRIYRLRPPQSMCFWEKIIATVVTDLQQHKPRCDGGHMSEHTMLLAWSVDLCIYCFVYLINCPWC